MTAHSFDRVSWLTKLKRIELLLTKHQEIKFNNLGYIIDPEMLSEQYKELSSKKAVGSDYKQRGIW